MSGSITRPELDVFHTNSNFQRAISQTVNIVLLPEDRKTSNTLSLFSNEKNPKRIFDGGGFISD
jgi:hypothetical protein